MTRNGYVLAIASGLMTISGSALGGATVVAEYEINDHPNGGLVPPTYALRLDNIFGFEKATFSADTFNDATLTVLQDDAGGLLIDIAGTFHGGEDLGGTWGTTFDIAATFRYAANVAATANGWQVTGFTTLNNGVLTRLDTNESTVWYGMEDSIGENGPIGGTFTFAADGWKIPGDDSTWVGRGWLTQNDDGSMTAAPAQDWFFSANLVPAPGAMALLGLGGLAAARRRR
jgi:hypothetical protein